MDYSTDGMLLRDEWNDETQLTALMRTSIEMKEIVIEMSENSCLINVSVRKTDEMTELVMVLSG